MFDTEQVYAVLQSMGEIFALPFQTFPSGSFRPIELLE